MTPLDPAPGAPAEARVLAGRQLLKAHLEWIDEWSENWGLRGLIGSGSSLRWSLRRAGLSV
jgi:hypothetical protein